jgi:NAD(P)-dependent dehydrogenase (short-subunit alcohol dehydrogenase family)
MKTLAIVGFGPGTATAMAEKFGFEGFSIALIGRNEERLAAGVSALKARGIDAFAFLGDAGDPKSIRSTLGLVRKHMGPISVLHWNAYGGTEAGDLLDTDDATLHRIFDVAVYGLLAATQEVLRDLKRNSESAILISNGAFGEISPEIDGFVISAKAMGLAMSSAAKNKLAGLLAARLKTEGVYVGEVTVHATIKGTPSDGAGSVDPAAIAAKHWQLYTSRTETRGVVS